MPYRQYRTQIINHEVSRTCLFRTGRTPPNHKVAPIGPVSIPVPSLSMMASMRLVPEPGQPESSGPEVGQSIRRRFGRLPLETLECNLGTILDLSAGGMRVQCRRIPKLMTPVQIEGFPMPQPLHAKVTWARRVGLFRHEVGLQFVDVTPQLASILARVAGCNRLRRVM
jgi:hypothetical protein